VKDYVSESSLPVTVTSGTSKEDLAKSLQDVFISAGRLTSPSSRNSLQACKKKATKTRRAHRAAVPALHGARRGKGNLGSRPRTTPGLNVRGRTHSTTRLRSPAPVVRCQSRSLDSTTITIYTAGLVAVVSGMVDRPSVSATMISIRKA